MSINRVYSKTLNAEDICKLFLREESFKTTGEDLLDIILNKFSFGETGDPMVINTAIRSKKFNNLVVNLGFNRNTNLFKCSILPLKNKKIEKDDLQDVVLDLIKFDLIPPFGMKPIGNTYKEYFLCKLSYMLIKEIRIQDIFPQNKYVDVAVKTWEEIEKLLNNQGYKIKQQTIASISTPYNYYDIGID